MDQIVVDCGAADSASVEVGDEVVLIGRQGDQEITADEWAGLLGTISYEVLCDIGPRVPRLAVGRSTGPVPTGRAGRDVGDRSGCPGAGGGRLHAVPALGPPDPGGVRRG